MRQYNKTAKGTWHGKNKTPEHMAWTAMKQRCLNKNNPKYHSYGGRGITICDRWINSFENFLEDMGSKPDSTYSLDRTDNDGDYSPDNCRWATLLTQNNNTSKNRYIKLHDKNMTIPEWSRHLNIPKDRLYKRLYRGWSIEKVLGA